MPTEESNLARTLKALLSVADVTLVEEWVYSTGMRQRGFRLTLNGSVVLDSQHMRAVKDQGIVVTELADGE